MNKKTLTILGLIAAVSLCLCGETPSSIMSVASTNAPSTWEGVFRLRDIHPITLESNEMVYLAIYTNSNLQVSAFEAALRGVIVDVFGERASQAVRLLSAGANNWGSTPHILAFGSMLPPENKYWSIWRVPGNGGNLTYERYAYTNGVMTQTDAFVYEGKPDFKWYRENGIAIPPTEIPPLDFSGHHIIWRNTNTVYKLEVYDFNFPDE